METIPINMIFSINIYNALLAYANYGKHYVMNVKKEITLHIQRGYTR